MTYKEAYLALVAQMQTFNAANEVNIRGIEGDVTGLNEKIVKLEEQLAEVGGEVTQADADLAAAAVEQSGSLVNRFKALDDLTPPVVPPEPTA